MRGDSNAAAYVPRGPKLLGQRIRVPQGAMVADFKLAPKDGEPRAVTAAAQVLSSKTVGREVKRPGTAEWQRDAWALRDEIGEFRFIGDRQARACSQVRLFIGRKTTPDSEPDIVTEGRPAELSKALFSNQIAVEQALRRGAQHVIYNGESILLVTENGTSLDWSAHSVSELSGGKGKWKLNDGLNPRDIDADTEVVVRAWNPHPEKGALADAPSRAVLPAARELRGLTQFVGAQIDSRLAGAGLLILPQGMVSTHALATGDASVSFADELTDYFITPIKDRESAAAVVPFMATVPPDLVDKIQHITFDSQLDAQAPQLRDEAIRRIGLGMDSDPSVLLGQASSNHWSAWAVDENEVKYGVIPVVSTICHALTVGLLHPLLEAEGIADATEYVVWYDATPLQVRADKSKDAQSLFDKDAIGAVALRRETGFDDADKPTDQELEARKLWQLLQMRPDWADKILPRLGIYLDDVGGAPESAEEAQVDDESQTTTPLDSPTGEAPPPENSPPTMEPPA